MNDKTVAWCMTFSAIIIIFSVFSSGNWSAAFFAVAAAWFAWMVVDAKNNKARKK